MLTTSETTNPAVGVPEPVAAARSAAIPSDGTVPLALLARLRDGEFDAIEELLAPDVWLRNLLVRRVHESHTAAEAVAAFRSWVGSPHGAAMIEMDHRSMAGRDFIRYRFRVRPIWAPEQEHVLEQAGYCRVKEGRITRFDLACTGYHPVGEPSAAPLAPGRFRDEGNEGRTAS